MPYRISGSLANTDIVMNQTFWLGIYPGITTEMMDFVAERTAALIKKAGAHAVRGPVSRKSRGSSCWHRIRLTRHALQAAA